MTTQPPRDPGQQLQDRRPRVPMARWTVPARIDLDPERQWLCWSGGARSTLVRARDDIGEELLAGFVGLADASPDEIVRFARRWGLLGAHYLGNYPDLLDRADDDPDAAIAATLAGPTQWRLKGREPLAAWHCWSQHAGALVRVAEEVRHGRVGRPRDVAMLCHPSPTADTWPDGAGLQPGWLRRPDSPPAPTLRNHRDLVEVFTARWLAAGHVRPTLRWTATTRTVELAGRGLLGALAAHLLAAVHGTTSLATCSGCSRLYWPTRTPRDTQRHFCGRCQADGEPLRHAKRDSRARARARSLADKGWSASRIATTLNQTKDTIDTWLASRAQQRRRRQISR